MTSQTPNEAHEGPEWEAVDNVLGAIYDLHYWLHRNDDGTQRAYFPSGYDITMTVLNLCEDVVKLGLVPHLPPAKAWCIVCNTTLVDVDGPSAVCPPCLEGDAYRHGIMLRDPDPGGDGFPWQDVPGGTPDPGGAA